MQWNTSRVLFWLTDSSHPKQYMFHTQDGCSYSLLPGTWPLYGKYTSALPGDYQKLEIVSLSYLTNIALLAATTANGAFSMTREGF